jgi:UPF0271 protein
MPLVDLNIDLGELPDEPEELYALATVVNLACGGHAGDVDSMRRSIELALRHGARIAAHPSYPDRDNFGRARMAIPPDLLYESVVDQVATLAKLAEEAKTQLWGAKLHGALYHAAIEDERLAAAVLDAIVSAVPNGVTIVGPPQGHFESLSRARGLAYAREGFIDRRYSEDETLVPRSQPHALLDEPTECAEQALRLARGGKVETLCVHGDGPNAVEVARRARSALEREGFLAPPSKR